MVFPDLSSRAILLGVVILSVTIAGLRQICRYTSGMAAGAGAAEDVLNFWFKESTPADHYKKSDEFDQKIRDRFGELHRQIAAGECCKDWINKPRSALASIIVLDQFSRNMFRDTPKAFQFDPQALQMSKQAVSKGYHKELPQNEASFMVLPHMHSEKLEDHDAIMPIYKLPGWEEDLKWEVMHRDIIAKFGRYPHRNKILGRKSTPEEEAFLKENPGF